MAEAVIADGSAFAKCKEMFAAQGGDTRVLDDYSLFEKMCIRDRPSSLSCRASAVPTLPPPTKTIFIE